MNHVKSSQLRLQSAPTFLLLDDKLSRKFIKLFLIKYASFNKKKVLLSPFCCRLADKIIFQSKFLRTEKINATKAIKVIFFSLRSKFLMYKHFGVFITFEFLLESLKTYGINKCVKN
jgi:hypothetical protein